MMLFQKYRTRNNTNKWSIFEDEYILNTKDILFVQSLKVGRSNAAIHNRIINLSKINRLGLKISNPTKTIGLRIVSKNSIQ